MPPRRAPHRDPDAPPHPRGSRPSSTPPEAYPPAPPPTGRVLGSRTPPIATRSRPPSRCARVGPPCNRAAFRVSTSAARRTGPGRSAGPTGERQGRPNIGEPSLREAYRWPTRRAATASRGAWPRSCRQCTPECRAVPASGRGAPDTPAPVEHQDGTRRTPTHRGSASGTATPPHAAPGRCSAERGQEATRPGRPRWRSPGPAPAGC